MSLFRCKGVANPIFAFIRSVGKAFSFIKSAGETSHGFPFIRCRVGIPFNGKICPDPKKRHSGAPPYAIRLSEIGARASYTVEAAVILPIFACVCVFALLLFRILTVEWGVETAIREVAQNMALYGETKYIAGASSSDDDEGTPIGEVLTTTGVAAAVTARIISLGVPVDYIDYNVLGLDYSGCSITDEDIVISVSYGISLPVGLIGDHTYEITQTARYRRWMGYDPGSGDDEKEEYVYVARYGEDYHLLRDCVYLAPSVRAVAADTLPSLRNKSGGKYRPCSLCAKSGQPVLGAVYITDYGSTYHYVGSCSGITRTVYRIERSEAEESYRPCPKCAH